MIIDESWDELPDETWKAFARGWLAELALEDGQKTEEDWCQRVVMMNFRASSAAQWKFILAAMDAARTADDRSHIAAGPVEHLLRRSGRKFIGLLEQLAAEKTDWSEMMARVWRHGFSDDVWERVQAIQGRNLG